MSFVSHFILNTVLLLNVPKRFCLVVPLKQAEKLNSEADKEGMRLTKTKARGE